MNPIVLQEETREIILVDVVNQDTGETTQIEMLEVKPHVDAPIPQRYTKNDIENNICVLSDRNTVLLSEIEQNNGSIAKLEDDLQKFQVEN